MKTVKFCVNGTLMRGFELEKNLTSNGAVFLSEDKTEKAYRLWSIDDKNPAMIRVGADDDGAAEIDVEIWEIPYEGLTAVLLGEPAGLSIGKVLLASGEEVLGVIAEPLTVAGKKEITAYGGWRKYLADK